MLRQVFMQLNGDDHTLTMTTAITTAMTMATTKQLHQDFSKIICDFRVSFVSQINWQPIGKLLFMIQPIAISGPADDTITQMSLCQCVLSIIRINLHVKKQPSTLGVVYFWENKISFCVSGLC